MASTSSSSTKYRCIRCKQNFSDEAKLQAHNNKCIEENKFQEEEASKIDPKDAHFAKVMSKLAKSGITVDENLRIALEYVRTPVSEAERKRELEEDEFVSYEPQENTPKTPILSIEEASYVHKSEWYCDICYVSFAKEHKEEHLNGHKN